MPDGNSPLHRSPATAAPHSFVHRRGRRRRTTLSGLGRRRRAEADAALTAPLQESANIPAGSRVPPWEVWHGRRCVGPSRLNGGGRQLQRQQPPIRSIQRLGRGGMFQPLRSDTRPGSRRRGCHGRGRDSGRGCRLRRNGVCGGGGGKWGAPPPGRRRPRVGSTTLGGELADHAGQGQMGGKTQRGVPGTRGKGKEGEGEAQRRRAKGGEERGVQGGMRGASVLRRSRSS